MNYGQANHYIRNSTIKSEHETGYGPAAMQADQCNQGLGGQIKNQQIASPMQRSVETLQKQVYQLEEVLTILSTRLAIVTRPQPTEQSRADGLASSASPLVERIDGITSQLSRLTQAIGLQLELLEL